MLYLGFVAVSKSREAIEINTCRSEEHTVLIGEDNPPCLYSLIKHTPASDDAVFKEAAGLTFPDLSWIIHYSVYDTGPVKDSGYFTLFSRPPPAAV